MYGLLPTQRVTAIPFWRHNADPSGESRAAQPDETPLAGGLPASPHGPARRLGYPGESSRAGGEGPFSEFGEGSVAALPEPAPSRNLRGVARQVKSIALGLIRFYQACLSPLMPSSCRFYPSCSAYAYEAVEKWGPWRGIHLALARLVRCRPYGGRGYDPVP